MSALEINLLKLYVPLLGWVGLGLVLGWKLPSGFSNRLGKLLFWVGVPISMLGFLRQANLTNSVWAAPFVAWAAILLGLGLALLWVKMSGHTVPSLISLETTQNRATQGSFLLASMVGNTGYLGYPVILTLVGPQHFAWALFYDMLGTTLGAYGLGVLLAARFSTHAQTPLRFLRALTLNPALWSFGIGLGTHGLPFPQLLEQGLRTGAWISVALSLLLIGMNLSRLRSFGSVQVAAVSLTFKMLLVPLLLGLAISRLGMTGAPRLTLVLQMAMPPAFATLVLAEAYDLDRELTVSALVLGTLGLLITLPVWLWLFPIEAA